MFAAILLGLLVNISPVQAAPCYTTGEAQAEQGIRIHSELMVIGLNCQNMRFRDGTNLYGTYRAFTDRNAGLFAAFETEMIEYYTRTGSADPESALNTLRTGFANKVSYDAARMKPYQFCNRYAGRVLEVINYSSDDLLQWAATPYPSHPVSQPLCEQ